MLRTVGVRSTTAFLGRAQGGFLGRIDPHAQRRQNRQDLEAGDPDKDRGWMISIHQGAK